MKEREKETEAEVETAASNTGSDDDKGVTEDKEGDGRKEGTGSRVSCLCLLVMIIMQSRSPRHTATTARPRDAEDDRLKLLPKEITIHRHPLFRSDSQYIYPGMGFVPSLLIDSHGESE